MSSCVAGVVVRRSIVNRHTRESGYPVRCGGSTQSLAGLEYWVARSSRAKTFVMLKTG
jgi:hypothetical protein